MSFEVMVGNKATATAVKLARVKVASAFPVTPQTTITEYLSEMVANGELDAEFINAEGELSTQVIVQAASRVGVRTFVCTSGPGQLYMHHPMHQTSANRLPVVMATVHRGNKGMQPDHTDLMSQMWTGWIQLYVEHNQEALDTVLMAYKVAEDPRVRLPVAVGYDGYVLSYTAEPVEIPAQEAVDVWLPPYKAMPSILPDEVGPESMGRGFGGGGDPQGPWREHHEAVLGAREVVKEVNEDYGRVFGRKYGNGLIEKYRCDDAEAVLVAMGSIVGTARAAVDRLQEEGKKVGLVKLKCLLPFPEEDFQAIGKEVGAIGMMDRNVCLGHGGAGFRLIRHSTYDLDERPKVLQYYAGLGGKEVRVAEIVRIGEKTLKAARGEKVSLVEWV
ncbi:MAG: pyruvate ferredoxin oxidoreductase [Candidatus Bathyarchaeota archaeon]|nr:pyruvate ferredoxin oxidoreductase [Candidatus Bathyarchaeota archaeon]MDH5790718.1 pyruvate ferredoxin oxidoreductase [Candidatus Bathyarchaeota archaeon]